jgi:hypothetical protein
MKHFATAIGFIFAFIGIAAFAQQTVPSQPPAPEPNALTLTLEEKITLTTDDLKLLDALEKAQKAYNEAIKPIKDHQEAAVATILKGHPGYSLQNGPQGWYFQKTPEEKKPEPKGNKPEPVKPDAPKK